MRTIRDWLAEYSASHVNTINQKFHFVCVPLIVFSVVCALKAVPAGDVWLNAATIVIIAALFYYLSLSWRLALGLLAVFGVFYAGALAVEEAAGGRMIWVALAIFVVGWVGQFIGHHIEGTRPSFFKDLQFLLIGPLWELAHLYRVMGIPIDGAGAGVAGQRGRA